MKIRIVEAHHPAYWYANRIGEVFEVAKRGELGSYFVYQDGSRAHLHRVIAGDCEIVNEEANEMPNGIIEQMQAEINDLKTKVGALEYVLAEKSKFKKVDNDEKRERAELVFYGRQFESHPGNPLYKSPQQIRDEIVAKAKADVETLKDSKGNGLYYYVEDSNSYSPWCCNVDFVVNREKRTVVAIMKGYFYSGDVYARGIAKADPSDCFNVHLGKAIALRRALGLEVPAEYYNAPAPTEVRVGDTVLSECTGGKFQVGKAITWVSADSAVRSGRLKIIDDSREVTE